MMTCGWKRRLPLAMTWLATLLAVLSMSRVSVAQCGGRWLTSPEQLPPGLNGTVRALAVLPYGDIIAGGEFTIAGGIQTNYIARWNGSVWMPLGLGVNDRVRALAVLPNGDLIAGGDFLTAGGVPANYIARWNGSSWSPLDGGVGGRVIALTIVSNGDLIAGGDFTHVAGSSANYIARWNGVSWSSLGTGMNDRVFALAVMPNGDVIAGGQFTTAGGATANRVARWDGVLWTQIGSGMSGGEVPQVSALAVLPNGHLVAGGKFTSAGSSNASCIAHWDGFMWSPLGTGVGGGSETEVAGLAVMTNGDIVAGGDFLAASGLTAQFIARWDGSSWVQSIPWGNNAVRCLIVLPDGDLVAGGDFTRMGDVEAPRVARLRGSSWAPLGRGLTAPAYALAPLPSGELVAGGPFTTAGAVEAKSVARWDGSSWMPVGSGVNSTVNALQVLQNGDLVAGGYFTAAGVTQASLVARWDGATWAPLGSGLTGVPGSFPRVQVLVTMPNGDIVAGGYFTATETEVRNRIARWNGSTWRPLGPGVGGGPNAFTLVGALAVLQNGDLVAGGNFTSAGGEPANRIARWDGTSWVPLGSGMSETSSGVRALAVLRNGHLVAGGSFTEAGGVPARNIARWDGSIWSSMGSGMNSDVTCLVVLSNGDLVAGGSFTTAGGVAAVGIARWNGFSWTSLGSGFQGGTFAQVDALALMPSGELVAGGSFTTAGGVPSVHWARWTESGIPWIARQPQTQSVNAGQSVTLSATCASGYDFNGPVTFQWQRNGVIVTNGPGGASQGGGVVTGASGTIAGANITTTLSITSVQSSDAGNYAVIFTNSCGAVTSQPAALSISSPPCYANCDNSTTEPVLNSLDIACFLNRFLSASALPAVQQVVDYANCDGSTAAPVLNALDFACFLDRFLQGCQ